MQRGRVAEAAGRVTVHAVFVALLAACHAGLGAAQGFFDFGNQGFPPFEGFPPLSDAAAPGEIDPAAPGPWEEWPAPAPSPWELPGVGSPLEAANTFSDPSLFAKPKDPKFDPKFTPKSSGDEAPEAPEPPETPEPPEVPGQPRAPRAPRPPRAPRGSVTPSSPTPTSPTPTSPSPTSPSPTTPGLTPKPPATLPTPTVKPPATTPTPTVKPGPKVPLPPKQPPAVPTPPVTPKPGLAPPVAPSAPCTGNGPPADFWSSKFNGIINSNLGKSDILDCPGDPARGDNAAMAAQIKSQLVQAAGCGFEFEVVVWDGTHGHDHQGANTLTYQNYCDGGMSGNPPGPNCKNTGGMFHGFCTGQGKSYGVFIHPKGSAMTNPDIGKFVQSCAGEANLLISYTKCVEKTNFDSDRLRGVLAIPTVGIPNRPNHWAATFSCTPGGFVWCNNVKLNGRDLTVFVVRPQVTDSG